MCLLKAVRRPQWEAGRWHHSVSCLNFSINQKIVWYPSSNGADGETHAEGSEVEPWVKRGFKDAPWDNGGAHRRLLSYVWRMSY